MPRQKFKKRKMGGSRSAQKTPGRREGGERKKGGRKGRGREEGRKRTGSPKVGQQAGFLGLFPCQRQYQQTGGQ